MEQKVFAPYVDVGGVPNILQCSHGFGGGVDVLFDVIIITEAKGDKGTMILEVAAEGDEPIFNCNSLRFLLVIIEVIFSFPARLLLHLGVTFIVGECCIVAAID
jgi:hypothetical protein